MIRDWLILAGNVGIGSIALALCKTWWNRRRLKRYLASVRQLKQTVFTPEDLTEDDWKSLAVGILYRSGFTLDEITKWLPLGVHFAKFEVTETLRKIQEPRHG